MKPDGRLRIDSILKTGLLLGGLGSGTAFFWGTKAAAGVAAGTAISLAGFAFLASIVPFAFSTRHPRFWLAAAGMLKLPILGLLLYGLIARGWVNPIGFCIGIAFLPIIFTMNSLRPRREAA